MEGYMTDFTLAELKSVIESCIGADNATELDASTLDVEMVDLGVDSLAVYEVVTRLQDDWHIKISDEEVDIMKTPRHVIDFVNLRLTELAR
jgi:acyl carrier protein